MFKIPVGNRFKNLLSKNPEFQETINGIARINRKFHGTGVDLRVVDENVQIEEVSGIAFEWVYFIGRASSTSYNMLRYFAYMLTKYFAKVTPMIPHPVAFRVTAYLCAIGTCITAINDKTVSDEISAAVRTDRVTGRSRKTGRRNKKKSVKSGKVGLRSAKGSKKSGKAASGRSENVKGTLGALDELGGARVDTAPQTNRKAKKFNLNEKITEMLLQLGFDESRFTKKVSYKRKSNELNQALQKYIEGKIIDLNQVYKNFGFEMKTGMVTLAETLGPDDAKNGNNSSFASVKSERQRLIQYQPQSDNIKKWSRLVTSMLLEFQNSFIRKGETPLDKLSTTEFINMPRAKEPEMLEYLQAEMKNEIAMKLEIEQRIPIEELKPFFLVGGEVEKWFEEGVGSDIFDKLRKFDVKIEELTQCKDKRSRWFFFEKLILSL